MSVASDELERQVREFVHAESLLPVDFPGDEDLTVAAGVVGDDLADLVLAFGRRFSVDLRSFRWYHHTGPEGCNPLWLLYRPWWARKTHIPIRLADLVESAKDGVWSVKYPDEEHRT